MVHYNYLFKVLLLGDLDVGKTSLVHKFMSGVFHCDTRLTIGVDFFIKTVQIREIIVKFQFWLMAEQPRFRFLLPTFCKGGSGAIIMYDITRADTLYRVSEWISMIRDNCGNVPIILVGNKSDLDIDREVSRDHVELLIEQYQLDGFAEISVKTGDYIDEMFERFTEIVMDSDGSDRRQIPPIRVKIKIPEFEVNKYLKLKLENGKTNIYVKGKLFNQCKYLLFNIPTKKVRDYDEIRSIDEAAETLDRRMENYSNSIPPETEFWGHCSNLQAWYENGYDTRLLHRNLAFPLLKALSDAGDVVAKRVFKEEIALRCESGHESVVVFLIEKGYLGYLDESEINTLAQSPNFVRNLLKVYKSYNDLKLSSIFRHLSLDDIKIWQKNQEFEYS